MILVSLYEIEGKADFVNLGIYKIGSIIFAKTSRAEISCVSSTTLILTD